MSEKLVWKDKMNPMMNSTNLQEDHDNRYVTDRVRQLDLQRKKRKKLSLMPLRKKERHHVIEIRSCTLSRAETKTLCVWLIFWFLFVLFGVILCVVDGGLHFVLGNATD